MNDMRGKSEIRWGFIGAGLVAYQFARSLKKLRGARLHAVCSKNPENARAFARKNGFTCVKEDADALVSDKAVDVVYIATPAALHKEHALASISAGKSVLLEKPFATNLADAEAIVSLAREAGVFCMEAMWMRFLPAYAEVKRRIASGEVGDPRMLIADFGSPVFYDQDNPYFWPQGGGGALLDRCVYPISMAVDLFGDPEEVQCGKSMLSTGVDDLVSVILKFPGNRMASLSAYLCAYGANHAVILGSRGRICIREPMCRPESFEVKIRQPLRLEPADQCIYDYGIGARIKEVSLVRRAGRAVDSLLNAFERTKRQPYRVNGYYHEAEEVMRCLRLGLTESERMPLVDSIRAMQIIAKARDA